MQGLRQGSVLCKLKLLHCQDSFSAARQISVALLTKRSKSTSRLLRRWDDIGLGFFSTWERYLTPEEYSPLAEWTSNRFGIGYNRLGAIRLAQDFEGGQSWKKALQLLRSSRLCLSSLLTSQWVLCQLEVCPYKPRDLSLLGQSVVG